MRKGKREREAHGMKGVIWEECQPEKKNPVQGAKCLFRNKEL